VFRLNAAVRAHGGVRLLFALLALLANIQAVDAGEEPCDDDIAELQVALRSDSIDPLPGDLVELEAEITNTGGSPAGIPLFQLSGAEPLFAIEEQDDSYPLVEFAHYRLRAERPGQTALQLSVNFETSNDCDDLPLVVFRSARSLPYVITVRGDARRWSATPTTTPTLQRSAATPAQTSAASLRR
jgi:hypothetical protein